MSDEIQMLIQLPHELAQNWGWFLAFGIGVAVLGVAGVVRSFAATVASMLFFGWLLLAASGIEIAQAVMVGHWAGFFQHLLAAILFGVTGLLMVVRPRPSAELLTLFMAAFFLVGGLFQIVVATAFALPGSAWQVADGVITVALGLLVMAEWPASALWAIGLFLGIDLIVFGFTWIAFAFGLRSM
jgi:uncharacterized membrane protein HdeD (DUF308 family)